MEKTISVVVPVLNEELSITHFLSALQIAVRGLDERFEIIFVDDGSTDKTLAMARSSYIPNWDIIAISLSRRFGKEAAISAGLARASGDATIVMDVDLQDPPSLIPEMVSIWKSGHKVVVAKRKNRDSDSFLKRNTAMAFYWLQNKISSPPLPANVGDFRLLDRQVVTELLKLNESNRFMKGIFAWVGFPTAHVEYVRDARVNGKTKFGFFRLFSLALDGITSFSIFPLRLFSILGLAVSLVGFVYALFLILRVLISGIEIPGYSSIMVSLITLSGIQLLGIGLLGEYVGRTYLESKNRPVFIVNSTFLNGERLE